MPWFLKKKKGGGRFWSVDKGGNMESYFLGFSDELKYISGFLLLFGVSSLTELTRLGSSAPIPALLTHFLGVPCLLLTLYLGRLWQASFWLVFLPELLFNVGLVHRPRPLLGSPPQPPPLLLSLLLPHLGLLLPSYLSQSPALLSSYHRAPLL